MTDAGAAPPSSRGRLEQAAAVRREVVQLGILVVIAVAAFFATRAVAASNREMGLRDAAEWYRRGELALGERRIDDAVDAFRRATVRNRTNTRYVLALARALTVRHDEEAARAALLSLRESSPENPEINLELARLAAARQDVGEALRFYHSALYAPWLPEEAEARRGVRLELVEFLLGHNEAKRAVSELLALSTDLPDDASHHLRLAGLFDKAGDPSGALAQYEAALARDGDNAAALAGAGRAAFQLGDYVLARRRLRRAPPAFDDVRGTLDVVDLVLSRDPLANRIGSAERRRRLAADVDYARQRSTACVERRGTQSTGGDAGLEDELRALADALKASPLEQDAIESAIDLIARVERRVDEACGPATAMDRALLLIARLHGSDTQ
jgi:tetratricopeptide (TPR) repeat protein